MKPISNDMPCLETDAEWMRQCIALAQQALPADVPVGALALVEGVVVARAFNRREAECNPVGHAEMLVLQAAAKHLGRWRLNDVTLVVTLEPCPMCASAIIQARVERVVFGAFDPVMGAAGSRYNLFADFPGTLATGGVLETDCASHLRQFFKASRNT